MCELIALWCYTLTVPAWSVAAAAWRDLCSYFIRNIICSAPGSQQQAARVQDTTVELQTKVFEDYAKLYTAATLALLYAPYEEVLMIFL